MEASREAVRRAHERAADMQQRAQRVRESIRARADTHEAALSRNDLSLFEEQSARAVRENQRFVAVLSHELRQPLNAAMGAMSLLDADPSPAATERARVVLRRQLLHMSTLLDDLLDMSRLALKKIRVARVPIDVRQLLEDAVDAIDPAARNAGVHLTCSLPDAPLIVVADAGRLQQAFSNLLTNGVRYTPSGGCVNVSLTLNGTIAEIHVEDTGQGITESDLASIFEPFWRGHDSSGEGFGIGLALVRGIVELHDGSIQAFSDGPGKGARFCISLPIAES